MCAPIQACWARCFSSGFKAEEAAIAQRAQELLDYVGIGRLTDFKARTLSYGDQRRLKLPAPWLSTCVLIVLDEPVKGANSTGASAARADQ